MRSNLREIRKSAGLTQSYMAEKLGYKYTSGYNQLETGKRRIDIELAKNISEILQKPLEEIFFEQKVVTVTTESEDRGNRVKKVI